MTQLDLRLLPLRAAEDTSLPPEDPLQQPEDPLQQPEDILQPPSDEVEGDVPMGKALKAELLTAMKVFNALYFGTQKELDEVRFERNQ
jgi:hypothetical protein